MRKSGNEGAEGTRGQGDKGTRGQGDKGTRGQEDKGTRSGGVEEQRNGEVRKGYYPGGGITILHVLDSLGVGGAEQTVLNLVGALDREHIHSVVCTLFSRDPGKPEPLAEEIRCMGIPVYQIGITSCKDLRNISRFLQVVRTHNIDIVHSQTVYAAFWSAFLLRASGHFKPRIVYSRQNVYVPQNLVARIQTRLLITLANQLIAVSQSTYRNLIHVCHADPQKILSIPNSVDIHRFSPTISGETVRQEVGIPPDMVVVGNSSRLEPRKGYDVFLKTAQLVATRLHNVKFLIAGYSMEEEKYKRITVQLGISDRVYFLGVRRDMPEVVAAMDIFLFTPYWGEGLPLSVIEAMAAGKPVVASNVGSNSELVIDGVSGFLPAPHEWTEEANHLDASALADKVMYLIENRDMASSMGREGRRIAETRFSYQAMARQTEIVYERLMGCYEIVNCKLQTLWIS